MGNVNWVSFAIGCVAGVIGTFIVVNGIVIIGFCLNNRK